MKKPFYQRVWFIALVVVIVLGAIGAMMDDGDKEVASEPETLKPQKEMAQDNEKENDSELTIDQNPKTLIENELKKKFKDDLIDVNGVFDSEPYFVQVELNGSENLTQNMTVKSMYKDVRDAVYIVKEHGYEFENLGISVKYPLIDKYGNESDEYVIKSDFRGETIKKLADDKNKITLDNVPEIADSWWEHPALSK